MTLLAPGMRHDAPTFTMAIEFGRITFPYLLFISLAALYGGVLNSIDRFAHVAATPILLRVVDTSTKSSGDMSCPTVTVGVSVSITAPPCRRWRV